MDGAWLRPGPDRAAGADIRLQNPYPDSAPEALPTRACDAMAPGGGPSPMGIRDPACQASESDVGHGILKANDSRTAPILPVSVVFRRFDFDSIQRRVPPL